MTIKLVIFDRDNTLIKDNGYTHIFSEKMWLPGIKELIFNISTNNIKIAVATNQSGVARGFFSLKDVEKFHTDMLKSLSEKGFIHYFKFCPHHPDGISKELAYECDCRKPKPGMLLDILDYFKIESTEAIYFGDKEVDKQAGLAAEIQTHRIETSRAAVQIRELLRYSSVYL